MVDFHEFCSSGCVPLRLTPVPLHQQRQVPLRGAAVPLHPGPCWPSDAPSTVVGPAEGDFATGGLPVPMLLHRRGRHLYHCPLQNRHLPFGMHNKMNSIFFLFTEYCRCAVDVCVRACERALAQQKLLSRPSAECKICITICQKKELKMCFNN
jgi:hypothetical protein